jgi:hypothetical protein
LGARVVYFGTDMPNRVYKKLNNNKTSRCSQFFIIKSNHLIYRLIFVQINDTPDKQKKSVRFWILPSELSTEIVDVLILAAGFISV